MISIFQHIINIFTATKSQLSDRLLADAEEEIKRRELEREEQEEEEIIKISSSSRRESEQDKLEVEVGPASSSEYPEGEDEETRRKLKEMKVNELDAVKRQVWNPLKSKPNNSMILDDILIDKVSMVNGIIIKFN